jgi:probable FeS assembly SUF system protein SufT
MKTGELIELKRECKAIEIPGGIERLLPAGSFVRISQMLGSNYTVITDIGSMCRIDASDADALGANHGANQESIPSDGTFSEQAAWDQLKTIYDPEIPVNIVDLGLVYSCTIASRDDGGKNIEVKMAMTAPGCGMANILKADVERKLGRFSEVKNVQVEVVFDPPWNPSRMSEAARLQLGLDLDSGSTLRADSKLNAGN